MKAWLKGGLIGGIIAVIPILIGLLALLINKEECLGCLIFFLPGLLLAGTKDNPGPLANIGLGFLGALVFIPFNFLLGFIIGAIINLIRHRSNKQ